MSKSAPLRILSTCLWLLQQLQQHKRITYQELNELWLEHSTYQNKAGNYDLEKRTLRNYWKSINEMFMVEVRCDRRTNEYYLAENYDSKLTDWMLSSFSISSILGESKEIHDRILLEPIPSGQIYLTTIIAAMNRCHPLHVTYRKFQDSKESDFVGHPLCLKLVQQRWYVLMEVPDRDFYPVYALDRILSLEVVESATYQLPEGFDASQQFEYSFGAFASEKTKAEDVVVKVSDFERKYWRTLPIHHSQVEVDTYADYSIFVLNLAIQPDFVNYLMSLGAEIEVLQPASLRKELCEAHKKAAQVYGQLNI